MKVKIDFLLQVATFWARPQQHNYMPTYSSTPLWICEGAVINFENIFLTMSTLPVFGPSSIDSISLDLSVVINTPWLVFCHHSFLSILIMIVYNNVTTPSLTQWPPTPLCDNKTIKKLSQRLLVIDVSLNKHHLFNKYIINPKYIILNQFSNV